MVLAYTHQKHDTHFFTADSSGKVGSVSVVKERFYRQHRERAGLRSEIQSAPKNVLLPGWHKASWSIFEIQIYH